MSKPITKEQRPEREAMKGQAQLERENAAKYLFGKVQYFIERKKRWKLLEILWVCHVRAARIVGATWGTVVFPYECTDINFSIYSDIF